MIFKNRKLAVELPELDHEAQLAIARVIKSTSEDIISLCKLAGLDPRTDLEYRNLSRLDFGRADLRGISLKGADVSGSILDLCIIDSTTNVDVSRDQGTIWPPKANFTNRAGLARILLYYLSDQVKKPLMHALREVGEFSDVVLANDQTLKDKRGMTYVIGETHSLERIVQEFEFSERISALLINRSTYSVSKVNFYSHGHTVSIYEFRSSEEYARFAASFIKNTFVAYFAR